jgi:hypothetical protein
MTTSAVRSMPQSDLFFWLSLSWLLLLFVAAAWVLMA